jgi:hypothetical protein
MLTRQATPTVCKPNLEGISRADGYGLISLNSFSVCAFSVCAISATTFPLAPSLSRLKIKANPWHVIVSDTSLATALPEEMRLEEALSLTKQDCTYHRRYSELSYLTIATLTHPWDPCPLHLHHLLIS